MQFPFQNPNSNPNPNRNPFQNPFPSLFQTLKTQATNCLQSAINNPKPHPLWARISPPPPPPSTTASGTHRFDLAMSAKDIEERLAGVPVYALSNAAEEFVLVSGVRTGKSLGLFCFKKEDAEALLDQMRSMNVDMREGSRVVPVALNKVFQLKVNGVAFRLIPDPHQVANALKEKEKIGDALEEFPGVPVFQSKSLALRSQNKRYRPVFFRKEDLEDTLLRASQEQNQLNPAFRKGDVQVCVLEDMVTAMKGDSPSKWDDVVFIPPGFNVPTDFSEERPIVSA